MLKFAWGRGLLLGLVFCLATHLNSFADTFKFGYCPITGNQIITSDGKILPNYRIVWFDLSNGSKMPLAVDMEAVNIISEADFERIMDWVRQGWMFEINNKKWTPKEIQDYKDKFFNLTIVRYIK